MSKTQWGTGLAAVPHWGQLDQFKSSKSMKAFFVLFLCLVTQAASFSQDDTNDVNGIRVAAAAQEFFAASRTIIGNAIEAKLKNKTITLDDLDALVALLAAETNKLGEAGFDGKLDLAVRQVETVQTQAVAILRDPANKAMAETLVPQEWLDEIARQKAVGKILESDTGRLRATVEELRRWAALLAPVAPPDQLANGLKSRLAELLSEWRELKTDTGQAWQTTKAEISKPVARTDPDLLGNQKFATNLQVITNSPLSVDRVQPDRSDIPVYEAARVPASVGAVLRLAEIGTAEEQITAFVDAYPTTFGLDAGKIIYIHDKVPSAVICRMIQHDAAISSNAAKQKQP